MKKQFVILFMFLGTVLQAQSFDFACSDEPEQTYMLGDFIPGATLDDPSGKQAGVISYLSYHLKVNSDNGEYVMNSDDTKFINVVQQSPTSLTTDGHYATFKSSLIYDRTLIPLPEAATTSSADEEYNGARVNGGALHGFVRVQNHSHYETFAIWNEGDTTIDIKLILHTENNGNDHKLWTFGQKDSPSMYKIHTIKIDLYNVLNLY